MRNFYNKMMAGVTFAPPGEISGMAGFGAAAGAGSEHSDGGQGGAGGAGAGGEHGSTQQHPLIGEFSNGDDSDEDADLNEILSAFGSGDEDDIPEEIQIGDIPQEEVDAVQNEVKNLISQIKVPDNMIPENFDPTDRAQMNALLSRTAQAAVSSALGVVFKPVQLAMKQMASQIQGTIDNKINASNRNNRDSNIIADTVPEINDPKYKVMLQAMDKTLTQAGKKPAERAKTMRKLLNQMGVTPSQNAGNRRQSTGGPQGGSSIKTGKAALDSFFGNMPTFK